MDSEGQWLSIEDAVAVEALLRLSVGFHDGVTDLARWVGQERVDEDGHLSLGGPGDLIIVVSSQLQAVPRLELRFGNVSRFLYNYSWDLVARVELGAEGLVAKFLNWEVSAESLRYRVL